MDPIGPGYALAQMMLEWIEVAQDLIDELNGVSPEHPHKPPWIPRLNGATR